jgi:hypothetical protein
VFGASSVFCGPNFVRFGSLTVRFLNLTVWLGCLVELGFWMEGVRFRRSDGGWRMVFCGGG